MAVHPAPVGEDVPGIVAEICARYGVGPRFARANVDGWCGSQGRVFRHLSEILSLPAPLPVWFEYALSTNQRAAGVYDLLRPHLTPEANRYLEVGSAYGGSMVAFARHGFEVRGIEIDPCLAELARANFADHGLPDVVVRGSILDDSVVRGLGTYDAMTCSHVIEHVRDVSHALRNMVSMLRTRGVLLLEVPNRDSLHFVARDGHFSLFGITQLERPRAERYYRTVRDGDYDHMGEYYHLPVYRRLLEALGCTVDVIPVPAHETRELRALPGLLAHELWPAYLEFLRDHARRLPVGLSVALHAALARYLGGLGIRWGLVRGGRRDPAPFRARYLTDGWSLLVRKR